MIILVANLKGGSGKSTIVFNLALWLQFKGQPVVTYDLDPQATLSDVAQVRIDQGLMPPLQVYGITEQLADRLSYHPGHVLVDVGASSMQSMHDAISVADIILVPVPPSQPDVWATQRFLQIVHKAPKQKTPRLMAFVNRADTHSAVRETDEAEQALKSLHDLEVLPTRVCQRTAFRRTLSEGMSIMELESKSKAAEEFNLFAQRLFSELQK